MQYPLKSLFKGLYLRIRKALLFPFLFLRKIESLPKKEIKNILFLRHDRIGDMVISTAALKALRKRFPDARITVLASDRNHEVIENNPNVDEIVVYKGFYWFIKEMRARRLDLTVDPFYTYELKQAFISYLSGARYRIGFEEAGREIFFNLKGPGISPAKQFVDHMLELIACLGGDVKGCKPELFLTEEEGQWASRFLADRGIDSDGVTVAIHPGGYYETQRWLAERFGLAAKRLIDELKANVVVIGGGQGEAAVVNRIKEICGGHVSIISDISIRQLIAILGRCNLFLGNNSGPLHIAAALGLPTVSIAGPTVFPLWLPYGENHIVLRKELDCSPCSRSVCNDHRCMELIAVEEVIDAVREQFKKVSGNRMKCDLCENEGFELFLKTDTGDGYIRCVHCGLIRLDNIPQMSDVKAIYDSEYFVEKSGDGTGADFIGEEESYLARFKDRIKRIEKRSETGRILDIGASVGQFMFAAQENGWDVSGVEVSVDAVKMAKERYNLNIHTGTLDEVNLERDSFDVITLWHVFEHFKAPTQSLRNINKLLKKDGLLVMELPNIGSKEASRAGFNWSYLRPGEHLYHYTPDTITRFLEHTGFKVEAIEYEAGGTGMGEGMDRMGLGLFKKILVQRFPPARWIKRVVLGMMTAKGSKEMIIVYARKR